MFISNCLESGSSEPPEISKQTPSVTDTMHITLFFEAQMKEGGLYTRG